MNLASKYGMIRRKVLDVTKQLEFFDAFMIGYNAVDMGILHYFFSGNINRALNIICLGKLYNPKYGCHVPNGDPLIPGE